MIDYQNTLALKEENGVLFRLMTQADIEESAKVFAETFQREIMVAHLGISADRFYPFALAACQKAIDMQMGVVAEDVVTGEIAGIVLTQDLLTEEPDDPEFFEMIKPFEPLFALLDDLMLKYLDQKQVFITGEVSVIFVIGVSSKYARTHIAKTLVDSALELNRRHGYKTTIAEVTSAVSQRLARRSGFKELIELEYSNFEFDGKRVFESMNQLHPTCILMEVEL